MSPGDLGTALGRLADEAAALVLEKRERYGRENIAQTGMVGVAVRVVDKAHRLYHLATHPEIDPGSESIRDTLRDLTGYGLVGQLLEEGKW